MHKSFIDSIFPPSSSPLLPQHERNRRDHPSGSASSTSAWSTQSRRSRDSRQPSLSPTPAVPPIPHSDPLLPVDRASKSLQRHIQTLLDAQSDGLLAGLGAGPHDEISSAGSLTPTPSLSTPPRSATLLPIRQPKREKLSLHGARKGLAKSMHDFALLKAQERRILDEQIQSRAAAVAAVHDFEQRRNGLNDHIHSIQHEGGSASAQTLREEANNLDQEIKILEDRLFEMKARHRRLLDQASQIESSVESKISSYRSSLVLVEKQVKEFLKRPPVPQSLSLDPDGQGIYALKAERRTLDMARDQWSNEQDVLNMRMTDVDSERVALQEGEKMWRETVSRISKFERRLRTQTNNLAQSKIQNSTTNHLSPVPDSSPELLLQDLTDTISHLESNLSHAESNHWNLLICCIGAELEAFRAGKALLEQTFSLAHGHEGGTTEQDLNLDPPDDPLTHSKYHTNGALPTSPSNESNKSLEATLQEFGYDNQAMTGSMADPPSIVTNSQHDVEIKNKPSQQQHYPHGMFGPSIDTKSESEDDDPGPDFFLSHA